MVQLFDADGRCGTCGGEVSTGGCITCQMRALNPVKTPHTCPVCSGQGKVSRPPWVPGDVAIWSSSGTELYPCPACSGSGVVWG